MHEPDVLIRIREVRDEMASRHKSDAWSLAQELSEQAKAAGRQPVRLPRRDPQPPRTKSPQSAA
jgi:hypothetical protein